MGNEQLAEYAIRCAEGADPADLPIKSLAAFTHDDFSKVILIATARAFFI